MAHENYEKMRAEELLARSKADITKAQSKGLVAIPYQGKVTFSWINMGPGEALDICRQMATSLKQTIAKEEDA